MTEFLADLEGETVTYIDIIKYDVVITKAGIGPGEQAKIEKVMEVLKTVKYYKALWDPAPGVGTPGLTVKIYTKDGSRMIHYPGWNVDGVLFSADEGSVAEFYEQLTG